MTRRSQPASRHHPRRRRARGRLICPLLALLLALPAVSTASPERAAREAQQRTGGQVLAVRPSSDPQKPGYFVKILLSDGRVRVVYIKS